MTTPPLTDAEIARTRAALEKTRNADGSHNITQAARALNLPRRTIQHRIKRNPEVLARFHAPELPSSLPPIGELLDRRTQQGDRSIEADDARNLVAVKIHLAGPIGIWIWGDPHIDDDGCNMRLLREHVELAKHPYVISSHIGDIANFWIGRLARLYAEQSTSAREAWLLVEWLLTQHEHLFCVLGNHDLWQSPGNPIDWILRRRSGMVEAHGVRLALHHPCGAVTRVHARHDFAGRSMYNPNHGQRREHAFGFRDHLLVAGHLHTGADQGLIAGDGMVSQLVRVSGYKHVDAYAKQLGFPPSKIHSSALVIIDPREPETSRARVWVAPTVERGILFLDALRSDYDRSQKTPAKNPRG